MAKKIMLWIGLVIFILYCVIRIFSVMTHHYSWHEMDWNQDGETSVSEVILAIDVGKRYTIKNEGNCVEYFAYKDGLAVKDICSK
jgi:hypothetical protein